MTTSSRFPDFLCVGAGKSGTTSLHYYLKEHPQVYLPQAQKELYFWHINRNPNRAIVSHLGGGRVPETLKSYLGYFSDAQSDQRIGEVCPSYLYYHSYTIESLKEMHPAWRDLRIIIILREPGAKIGSAYRLTQSRGLDPEFLSFHAAIRAEPTRLVENRLLLDNFYKDTTRYASQVRAYLKSFPYVRIYLYEDLVERPNWLLTDLTTFLGVDPFPEREGDLQAHNTSGDSRAFGNKAAKTLFGQLAQVGRFLPGPARRRVRKSLEQRLTRKPSVDENLLMEIRKEFRPEVDELEKLIGRDLTAWKY